MKAKIIEELGEYGKYFALDVALVFGYYIEDKQNENQEYIDGKH